jgi:lipoprotein
MKNVLWILFLMVSVFSSCKKEEPGAQPEGQKEIVQLSFSGQLPEARDLVLTPKEVGGKLKVETKVTGRTLRVKMLISGANGYNQNLEGDVKMVSPSASMRRWIFRV